MARPRALLFDVFGTIVDWRMGVIRELAAFWPDTRRDGEPGGRDDWRGRYQPTMEKVRSGRRAFVPLDTLHRESLETVLAAHDLGADLDDLDELILAWHRLDPWPDVAPGLRRLAERFTIGTLSHANNRDPRRPRRSLATPVANAARRPNLWYVQAVSGGVSAIG